MSIDNLPGYVPITENVVTRAIHFGEDLLILNYYSDEHLAVAIYHQGQDYAPSFLI